MTNIIAFPIIAGVEISTDDEGRFNLNALHRASDQGKHKAPSEWLRRTETKALIEELELTVNIRFGGNSVNSVKGGSAPGTFAHELLAIEYAGWISPAFRLKVNQTFIDYKTGKLQPVRTELSRIEILQLAMDAEKEKQQLAITVEKQAPKIAAYERTAESDGLLCLMDAGKTLGIQPRKFVSWLSQQGYIYKRPGNSSWIAYQQFIQQGLFEHKHHTYEKSDGLEYTSSRALVTGKGLMKFAEKLNIGLDTAA